MKGKKLILPLAMLVFFNLISIASASTQSELDVSATVLGTTRPAPTFTGFFATALPLVGGMIMGAGLLLFVLRAMVSEGVTKNVLIYGIITLMVGVSMIGIFVSSVI